MRLKITMICLILMVMSGCASNSMLCTVPEATDSVICNLSTKLKTTPGVISQTLQVANLGALEANIYTARQADKFIDTLIADIQGIKGKEITYLDAVNYINDKFNVLPPRIQAVFIIINPAGLASQTIKMPLTNYDFELLLRHLQKQKDIIKMYL